MNRVEHFLLKQYRGGFLNKIAKTLYIVICVDPQYITFSDNSLYDHHIFRSLTYIAYVSHKTKIYVMVMIMMKAIIYKPPS